MSLSSEHVASSLSDSANHWFITAGMIVACVIILGFITWNVVYYARIVNKGEEETTGVSVFEARALLFCNCGILFIIAAFITYLSVKIFSDHKLRKHADVGRRVLGKLNTTDVSKVNSLIDHPEFMNLHHSINAPADASGMLTSFEFPSLASRLNPTTMHTPAPVPLSQSSSCLNQSTMMQVPHMAQPPNPTTMHTPAPVPLSQFNWK